MSVQRDPTFAVAFGGGGARGLSHIHVIEALDELGIRPVAIAGSSIGAIMGAGMATGMSGRDIRQHTESALGSGSSVASRIWKARPSSWADAVGGGFRIGQFDIERVVAAFLPEIVPARFEDLSIPLRVVATDYFAHAEAVFDKGELLPAIAASAAIPALFKPVKIDGRVLVDGGITNPVPFDHLEGMADIIIAIDVIGAPVENGGTTPGTIELLLGSSQIMMQSILALKLQRSRPQIMLHPPVSNFRVMDFLKIARVLEDTASIGDELKLAVENAVRRFEQEAAG